MNVSRRTLVKAAGVPALASPATAATAVMPTNKFEGPDTPKIGLSLGDGGSLGGRGAPPADAQKAQETAARRLKQLGVNCVLVNGGPIPWEESALKEQVARFQSYGLTLGNLMIQGFNSAIYARPGRDQDIEKVIASIQAAGKAGLPVVEYNWYAHRATEGYFEETGRAGAGMTGFDYEREVEANGAKIKFKDLPPLPNEGAHTLDEMWANIAYLLKRVIPACEKAGVRMALHPNDPPAPISRGSQQIMGSVEGRKSWSKSSRAPRTELLSIVG